MILSAQTIRWREIITPFSEASTTGGMTYGLGPAGYDIRIAQNVGLLPGDFRLASTLEHFKMDHDILGIVHDKSTWARKGLAVQNTVIEPGWRGYLTLELSNHGQDVLMIVEGMPIAQVIFHMLDHVTEQPYRGKYQDQKQDPQPAIVCG